MGWLVGLKGLEPLTPRLSSVCSNQLSYRPNTATVSPRRPHGLAIPLYHQTKGGKRNEDGDGHIFFDVRPKSASIFIGLFKFQAWINPRSGTIKSFLRKEVIQPQVPLRLPCYDFTPVADPTVVACLLAVSAAPSGRTNSHGVTGGVYKARERIHRGMLIRDY
jgi:hypothetical protein